MECIFERDYGGTSGVAARDLDGILYALRAAVRKEGFLWKVAGSDLIKFLSKRDVRLVHRDVKARMREVVSLVFDGFNYCGG